MVEHQVHDAVGVEIADPNGPHAALRVKLLHRAPGAINITVGLMDQVEVEVIQLEPAEGVLEGGFRRFVASVGDPELGRDEDLIPGNATSANRLADRFLVAVGSSRIDEPVAHLQGVPHAPLALLQIGNLKYTEAENRHFDTVVERDCFHDFKMRGYCRRCRYPTLIGPPCHPPPCSTCACIALIFRRAISSSGQHRPKLLSTERMRRLSEHEHAAVRPGFHLGRSLGRL